MGALVTGALLLSPALAQAARGPITIEEYQQVLHGVIAQLEAGRTPPRWIEGSSFTVSTPSGPIEVDLEPLRTAPPAEALPIAQQYLAAAQQSLTPTAAEAARAELAQIMATRRAQSKYSNLLQQLLQRLLFGRSGAGGLRGVITNQWTPWIAGAVGLIGLSTLAFFLYRGLRGHGAGADLAAKLGRAGRPERALTPDERWAEARALAAEGDWTAALRGGYLALLQALDRQGLLTYLPAQTNREHERQLRRSEPNLAARFANLTALVESRLFGGVAATAEDFAAARGLIEELWREGDALSRRADATTGASSSAPSH